MNVFICLGTQEQLRNISLFVINPFRMATSVQAAKTTFDYTTTLRFTPC